MKRENLTWDVVREVSTSLFGEKALDVSKDPNTCVLYQDDTVVALIINNPEIHRFFLHLRASLAPELAGYIAAAFAVRGDFDISDCIEVTDSKQIISGAAAAQLAANRQYQAIREGGEKETADVLEKKENGPIFIDNGSGKDIIH